MTEANSRVSRRKVLGAAGGIALASGAALPAATADDPVLALVAEATRLWEEFSRLTDLREGRERVIEVAYPVQVEVGYYVAGGKREPFYAKTEDEIARCLASRPSNETQAKIEEVLWFSTVLHRDRKEALIAELRAQRDARLQAYEQTGVMALDEQSDELWERADKASERVKPRWRRRGSFFHWSFRLHPAYRRVQRERRATRASHSRQANLDRATSPSQGTTVRACLRR